MVNILGEQNYYYLLSYDPSVIENARVEYGLDKPLPIRYFKYITRILRGDLGWTGLYEKPVLEVILFRLRWTLVLLLPATLASIVLGGLLGAAAGWRSGKKTDLALTGLFLLFYSIPGYCLGLLLMLLLAFHIPLFPLGGMMAGSHSGLAALPDLMRHMALPFATLVLHGTTSHYLLMRSSVRQIAGEDYLLTAISKGLSEKRVLLGHLIPNALPPLVTTAALEFGFMVGGALLIEIVFSWQGMGSLIHDGVLSRDYPLLSGCLLLLTLCVIAGNALADLAYAVIDPRVRDGAADARGL